MAVTVRERQTAGVGATLSLVAPAATLITGPVLTVRRRGNSIIRCLRGGQ